LATCFVVTVMRSSLRTRILALLVLVSILALSAAFLLRTLIIKDFGRYMDGETQDRVQHVVAILEGSYGARGIWEPDSLRHDIVWALMMGLEVRVLDANGGLLRDTLSTVEALPVEMKVRVLDVTDYEPSVKTAEYIVYPLFFKGDEIGRVEVRSIRPAREAFFISASNRFLLYTVVALGVSVLLLGIYAARRLTRPIKELSDATSEIAFGNLGRRVNAEEGPLEIASLANNFNRMADSLEAQEKLRRRLVSSAAHELRTPLTIISGELEGMIDGVLPINREGLQSMHDEAARLTAILNAVDDLTRAETAVLNLCYEEINLKSHLTAIVGRFERLFHEKNALLLLDCPDGLILKADPDRLSQIMINLISNAYKAIPIGGRTTVVASSIDKMIRITVSDNGVGISETEMPNIFERFYKGKNGGLGIGLAIVRELVNAHGGTVDVNSVAGEGTSFRITLP
jgi:two-component system, OmpR family, sensor histidine kinase BaeS